MKKTKKFTNSRVAYPVGYTLFLVVGILAFLWIAYSIQIPIYKTVDALVIETTENVVLQIGDVRPMKNTPLYVYKSRTQYIEKILDYNVDETKHVIKIACCNFQDHDKINIDLQIRQVSLLEYILFNGNNE